MDTEKEILKQLEMLLPNKKPTPDPSDELAELEQMLTPIEPEPDTSGEPAEPEQMLTPIEPEPDKSGELAELEEMIRAVVFEQQRKAEDTEPAEEPDEAMPEEPTEAASPEEPVWQAPPEAKKKRRFRGALWFYSILLVCAVGILALLYCLRMPLSAWLEQYENDQPQHTATDIYDMLFADPDWALLYDMAGIQPTEFEGRKEFVAYMEAKVGDTPLTCAEVAAGLSGQYRYSIRLGDEEVAAFTVVPETDSSSTRPWTIGTVELYFTRTESVTVNLMPGCTVYINGVPLDESYTIKTVHTAAENYLPAGLHGYRYEQQRITGLLVQPEVAVLDERNNPLLLTQDPITGVYTAPIADSEPMTQEQADRALEAAKAEALFSIRAISISELRRYFDPGSQAYEYISGGSPVLREYVSYEFDEEATVIDSYYRYSNDLFSIRATVTLNVTDANENVISFENSVTYFFVPNSAGTDMVSQRIEADLQQRITQVPLSYAYRDTVLQTDIVSTDTDVLTPPLVTDPDGIWPLGWAKAEADGSLTMVLELLADGTAVLCEGQTLEAMTLYPVFD